MIIATIALASALATPTPSAIEAPTPPPEPNHITLAGAGAYVATPACNDCRDWNGFSAQALGQYEFQVAKSMRFSDTLHWERLSTSYAYSFGTQTLHAPFDYDEYDDQLDVELGKAQLPTGVGIGYFDASPVYHTPLRYDVSGFGFGVDHWANWYVRSSPYVDAWYYPHLTGIAGEAYVLFRGDVGWNVRESLVSPWGVRIGLQYESWSGHDGAGVNEFNFFKPYVSITWWQ